jgi:hypothetical protein
MLSHCNQLQATINDENILDSFSIKLVIVLVVIDSTKGEVEKV